MNGHLWITTLWDIFLTIYVHILMGRCYPPLNCDDDLQKHWHIEYKQSLACGKAQLDWANLLTSVVQLVAAKNNRPNPSSTTMLNLVKERRNWTEWVHARVRAHAHLGDIWYIFNSSNFENYCCFYANVRYLEEDVGCTSCYHLETIIPWWIREMLKLIPIEKCSL